MSKMAQAYTLDTTFQLQLKHGDGTWSWTSQAEYTSREACLEEVAQMYGGAYNRPGRFRIIRHERHVEEY